MSTHDEDIESMNQVNLGYEDHAEQVATEAEPKKAFIDFAAFKARKEAAEASGSAKRPRGRPRKERPEHAPESEDGKRRTNEEIFSFIKPRFEFRFNALFQMAEISKEGEPWRPVKDSDIFDVFSHCRQVARDEEDVLWRQREVSQAVEFEVAKNEYDPITEYLEDCYQKYGDALGARIGKGGNFLSPLDDLLSYFKVEDDERSKMFIVHWMLGCAARAFEGFQNYTLVFGGKQGLGKSYFARWLCSGFGGGMNTTKLKMAFQEGSIEPHNKDHVLRLGMRWIWCADEIAATMNKADQNALKQFLTVETISERPPYARHIKTLDRCCNVLATVNDSQFLRDETGNRRYLYVPLAGLNKRYSEMVDVDLLWGQVMHLYKDGIIMATPHLPYKARICETLEAVQTETNLGAMVADPLEDFVMRWIRFTGEPYNSVRCSDVLEKLRRECIGTGLRGPEIADKSFDMRIAAILRKHGVIRKQKRIGKDRVWSYDGITWNPGARPD